MSIENKPNERRFDNKILQVLYDENHLSEEMIKTIEERLNKHKTTLLKELLSVNLSADLIYRVALKISNLPRFDLNSMTEAMENIPGISMDEMEAMMIYPLKLKDNILSVALSDPTDYRNIEALRLKTRSMIEPYLVHPNDLLTKFSNINGVSDERLSNIFKKDTEIVSQKNPLNTVSFELLTYDLLNVEDHSSVVQFINAILIEAIKKGASDIHFEPYEKHYRVRYRMDGVLQEVSSAPEGYREQIAARLKVMSQLDITERRIPQDGRIRASFKEMTIDFRISILPTLWGEKIVLRLLDSSALNLDILSLGLTDIQKEHLMHALSQSQGMILVTGPTGSGKTVTLYSSLAILNKPSLNISTVEDPIEINLTGINQVAINPKVGLDFAVALKAFLRQDPDVIMVGEIRDLETADIAIKAAQTGHLVLSTLHTNSAPDTLMRLMNMGIESFNLASTIQLIIAQRLARRLCNYCKKAVNIDKKILQNLGFDENQMNSKIYTAVGCPQCNQGYKGRIGIYEVLPISFEIEQLLLSKANSKIIAEKAQKEGIDNVRQSAIKKVVEGVISLEELLRVTTE